MITVTDSWAFELSSTCKCCNDIVLNLQLAIDTQHMAASAMTHVYTQSALRKHSSCCWQASDPEPYEIFGCVQPLERSSCVGGKGQT